MGTILLLITLATVLGINQARVQYEQAKTAGRHAHRTGMVRESIRRVEGARARRKTLARAQLMGAAGGTPVADPVLGQLGSDIDRQTELDVWGIREQTWRERFAARQAMQAAKNQAIQSGMSGLSAGIMTGVGGGAGGAAGASLGAGGGGGITAPLTGAGTGNTTLGSSYVSGNSYAYRLRPGTFRSGTFA